jgi:hypothetical protein
LTWSRQAPQSRHQIFPSVTRPHRLLGLRPLAFRIPTVRSHYSQEDPSNRAFPRAADSPSNFTQFQTDSCEKQGTVAPRLADSAPDLCVGAPTPLQAVEPSRSHDQTSNGMRQFSSHNIRLIVLLRASQISPSLPLHSSLIQAKNKARTRDSRIS